MNFRILGIIIFLGVISSVWANDMILTLDDEREVILHADSTWGFAKFTVFEGDEEDIYMTIDDGRTILLRTDNTWGYTKAKPPQKKSFKELPTVLATASSTRPTLDQAVQGATQEALKRAAARLLPYAKKSKMTQKYLIACIKNEIGDAGAEVNYKPGWTAQAKVNLDKVQVKKILECVEIQLESSVAENQEKKTEAK